MPQHIKLIVCYDRHW